jgi:DNA-directed RNA polymerase specialized sigma24 family protein
MFPETPWSLLAVATIHGDDAGQRAMESLCRLYYEPVKGFILWNGRPAADADDLTQGFFLHVCEKSVMRRADQERGKFRTFMISVLKHFLSHADRAVAAQKRGGNAEVVALEAVNDLADMNGAEMVERFDKAWAVALMDAALARLAQEMTDARGAKGLETLRLFLSDARAAPSYEEAALKLGMSVAAVKMEVMRWRRRLRELVRAEINRTVSAPHEAEEEFAYLRRLLMT